MTLPRNTLDRFASTVSLALRNFGRPSRATFLWNPRFLPIGLSPIAHLPSDFCRATFADQTITFQLFFANTRNMAYNKQLPLSAVSLQQFCLVSLPNLTIERFVLRSPWSFLLSLLEGSPTFHSISKKLCSDLYNKFVDPCRPR